MTVYKDKTFEGEVFILEECIFVGGELKGCHLMYSGGEYNFINTKITDCQFHLRGSAINTMKLLEFTGAIPPKEKTEAVEPPPLVN